MMVKLAFGPAFLLVFRGGSCELSNNKIKTVISDFYIFREAGLPTSFLNFHKSPKIYSIYSEIKALCSLSEQLSKQLKNHLYEAIKSSTAERDQIRMLLDLKRSIFKNVLPKNTRCVGIGLQILGEHGAGILHAWNQALVKKKELEIFLSSIYFEELEIIRKNIRAVSNCPEFLLALQISSPSLFRKYIKYQIDAEITSSREHRMFDRALYSYFLRSITKTSPLSTFCLVGFGLRHGKKGEQKEQSDRKFFTSMEINSSLIRRIAAALLNKNTSQLVQCFALNSTISTRNGKISLLRHRSRNSSQIATIGDKNKHSRLEFPSTESIDFVIRLFESAKTLQFTAIRDHVQSNFSWDIETTDSLIKKMIERSILIKVGGYDIGDRNELLSYLKKNAKDIDIPLLSDAMRAFDEAESEFSHHKLERREYLLEKITQIAQKLNLFLELNIDISKSTLVYENASLSSPKIEPIISDDTNIATTLKSLHALQPVFDSNITFHAALVVYFKSKYGINGCCTDITEFCNNFFRSFPFYSNETIDQEKTNLKFFPPEDEKKEKSVLVTRKLIYLNRSIKRYLRGLACDAAKEEVQIPLNLLESLRNTITGTLYPRSSASYFIQKSTNKQNQWVLHGTAAGNGQLMSRFLGAWEKQKIFGARSEIKKYLKESAPKNTILVELMPSVTSNLREHFPIMENYIALSEHGETRGERNKIILSDLSLCHDGSTDRIFLRRIADSSNIIPIFQSGLSSRVLTDIEKLLCVLGGAINPQPPNWRQISLPVKSDEVKKFPRITLGEIVILRRAWCIGEATIPIKTTALSDVEYYLSLQEWREKIGLPEVFYVTFKKNNTDSSGRWKSHKPMFFNINSPYSVAMFEHELREHTGEMWIIEADPDPETPGTSSEKFHTEYIFDISSTETA